MIPKLDDLVYAKNTDQVGKIIELNTKWGWAVVSFSDGTKKRYNSYREIGSLIRITKEQWADLVLAKEKYGLTDFWREY